MPPAAPDGKEAASVIPRRYALKQNYPNPFNPVTTITFDLPERIHTSVKVFNTLGQVVGTLIDEVRDAGIYTVRWDAGQYPSGVYYYQIHAGEFADVRKMILIK